MKLGTRVHVEFYGDVTAETDDFLVVEDEKSGVRHRIAKTKIRDLDSFWKVLPENWPPKPGDLWKHLNVSFYVEERKGTIWFLASNGEGSLNPDEVLRMRPGIRLVSRISDLNV